MRKRIDIRQPEETVELIDRVTEHCGRSRFIDEAVRHYLQETGRANLRKHSTPLSAPKFRRRPRP